MKVILSIIAGILAGIFVKLCEIHDEIKNKGGEKMKVYVVCRECNDCYYGFLAPDKIFKDKEKAQAFAKKLVEDYYDVTIKEYELE